MKRCKCILFNIILCIILSYLFLCFKVNASSKASGIDKFPSSYQSYLNILKQKHQNWNFIALYTNLDWNYVIKQENLFGKNLISKNYSDSWKNTNPSEYNVEVDKGWVDSSKKAVEFCVDPRNFLIEARIFQFEELTYNSRTNTIEGIEKILYGTEFYNTLVSYLDYNQNLISTDKKYSDLILNAGQNSHVSAYHLASRIKQEVGPFLTHSSISGRVKGFEGIYNFYNIGATSSTTDLGAIKNGLQYAKDGKGASQDIKNKYLIPWNTKERAITGGAIFIGNSYINIGQDTIYLQKFDVNDEDGNGLFWHQYMTNVLAPYSESKSIYNGYKNSGLLDSAMTFIIPVYENMPYIPTQNPDINENNFISDNTDMYINGENVNIRTGPSISYDIITTLSSPYSMKRIGKGIQETDEKWDKVIFDNNIVGYVYSKYLSEKIENVKIEFKHPLIENNNQIMGVDYNTNSVKDVKSKIITDFDFDIVNNKNEILNDTDLIGTGSKVRLKKDGKVFAEYTFIIYGDASGDGRINSIDLLVLQRHILEIQQMENVYQTAVKLLPNEKEPTSIDLLIIMRHILEIELIDINKYIYSGEKNMQKINMGNLDIEYNSKFNTNLENLAIENELLNPPFDNNITNYTVEVSNNKTNIQMLAIPENEKAKIQITGLGQLKEGDNLIKVTVISENESARKDYNINVHRRNIDEERNYENMQKKNEESLNQIYNANPQIISGADYTAEKTRSLNVEKKNTNNISDAYIIGLILFLIITIILINVLTKNKKR